jgi:putative spermidine/putrescine transport system substrate-binding protein
MQNKPLDNLEFALLADGVAIDKLYPLDIARAYRSSTRSRRHVTVWWKTGAQSAQLLIDKEVRARHGLERALLRGDLSRARRSHVEWNQGSLKESAFVIPKGAKDAHWAQQMFAGDD